MDDPLADKKGTPVDRVAVVDLADDLQVRKQWLFKIMKRLGIEGSSRRETDRRNQMVTTVSSQEAERIRREVAAFRDRQRASSTGEGEELDAEVGFFYLVQLEPDHDPGRIKVGFTTELDGRIRKHRCSAPFASYAKYWPSRRSWERTAIDCATFGLDQLHTEVFRASSLQDVIARADRFFAAMPPAHKREGVPGEP